MIEWLNEASNIEDYYSRYEELHNLVQYCRIRDITLNRLQLWVNFQQYQGHNRTEAQNIELYDSISSYYIFTWGVVGQLLSRRANSILDLTDEELNKFYRNSEVNENLLLTFCSSFDAITADTESSIDVLREYRNQFAHRKNMSQSVIEKPEHMSKKVKNSDRLIKELVDFEY